MQFDRSQITKPLSSKDDMPEELQEVLRKVKACVEAAEPTHRVYRDRWDRFYKLYRNYKKLASTYAGAERDRDGVLLDAQREWGSDLIVPWAFAIVETVAPRLLSNDPRMLVPPRNPDARASALSVQELINADQLEISYDLKLQPTAKRGLWFGLGVQKTFWNRKARTVQRVVPSASGDGSYAVANQEVVLYEGPDVEDVDPYDFFWDPVAQNIETARWVLHRTWRDDEYVARMVAEGKWLPLDLETVKGLKSDRKRDEVWAGRQEAIGQVGQAPTNPDKGLHEVWEYHSGEYVYTILDQVLVVQADKSPYYHRELPFQIFRPTLVPGEFVGIGVIEPIIDLAEELNQLRGQRRDNATVALHRPFMYREGRADPKTFKMGPGVGIPIQGDPSRDIVPLVFPDLPASSYREEGAIKQDMELASGISEATAGGTGSGDTAGTETATGMQLVQQAANVRIRLAGKNLERETIRPAARQWLELYRQHVVDPNRPRQVRVPDEATAEGYRHLEVGPEQLGDDLEYPVPDAGSTEPDNKVEREQRAGMLFQQLAASPLVNQPRLLIYYLKELGIRDAESFIVQQDEEVPKVDPRLIGEAMRQEGVDPDVIQDILEATLEAEQEGEVEDREAAIGEGP